VSAAARRLPDRAGTDVIGLPARDCLVVAIATPITGELAPDVPLLLARSRALLENGCDGIALFGTTGEGAHFAPRERMATLEALVAAGLPPARLVVATGALSLLDVVELSRHAVGQGVAACLLMPPCFYRGGLTEDGAFRWYAAAIDRIGSDRLRLLLYHFPDISGVPITPGTVRRLVERYGAQIAGIKDSGGDLDVTESLLRRFSELAVFTGTETHVPAAMASGARGTICGLANVIPHLMRRMLQAPSLPERRRFVPLVRAVDAILSRGPFIAAVKAVVAAATGEPGWRRMVPPAGPLSMVDEGRLLEDFGRFEESLPLDWREAMPRRGTAELAPTGAGARAGGSR
jgi:4-hydroxy-tetrahydrodipicolinate synthase